MKMTLSTAPAANGRRYFVGGSDARIIIGDDEAALLRLWQEKRGQIEPQDLSGNLLVQLGLATEDLNRRWYEANTGQVITDVQSRIFHPALFCRGRFRRKRRPKNICPSCNIICGWWRPERRCSP